MKLLLLSSSRAGNSEYLEHARDMISQHLDDISQVLFIPFAGVSIDWDSYTLAVQSALPDLTITGIHQHPDPKQAIASAEAILVGGGNTFNLLNELYKQQLLNPLRERVNAGVPYIGWSAGSNIAGLSIRTTNDMPIIQPPSFDALGLVPFQLNPHYSDYQPEGFHGETRAQRIGEFMRIEPDIPVLAIREGSALQYQHNALTLLGDKPAVLFLAGKQQDLPPGAVLDELLQITPL